MSKEDPHDYDWANAVIEYAQAHTIQIDSFCFPFRVGRGLVGLPHVATTPRFKVVLVERVNVMLCH